MNLYVGRTQKDVADEMGLDTSDALTRLFAAAWWWMERAGHWKSIAGRSLKLGEQMSKITDELPALRLDTAEAFFAITIHRENGRTVPTATVIADALSPEQRKRILEALITAATAEMQSIDRR